MRLTGYHGLTGTGPIVGAWNAPELYIAYERAVAVEMADCGVVYKVDYEANSPLVLDTPEAFVYVWEVSGTAQEDPRSFEDQKAVLFSWVREQGADAVCIPSSAFDGELGYEWVAGTFGEPQMILLEPERAVLTPC